MKMTFISDIHANFDLYKSICEQHENTIQLGDFGIGFGYEEPILSPTHRWIRGNHDNPELAAKHPNWIADGTVERIGDSTVMFIGGAFSIDWRMRTPGRDWWPDEELSTERLYQLIDEYERVKPDVMVTHDCPIEIAVLYLLDAHKSIYRSRTNAAFHTMFQIHQPKIWIFGHWHLDLDVVHRGTRFLCQRHIHPARSRYGGKENTNVITLEL